MTKGKKNDLERLKGRETMKHWNGNKVKKRKK